MKEKEKEILGVLNAVVREVFAPDIYNEDISEYYELYEAPYVGFKLEVDGKLVKFILPENKKYSNIFVGDKVRIIKYQYNYNYDKYVSHFNDIVLRYYSDLSPKEKNEKFKKLLKNKEEYEKNAIRLIDYDIELAG